MFSALDHTQRGPWLLEDWNHLMWPPMWQTGMTLTSYNTILVVPGGSHSAMSRNSKCCVSNASKLMLLNDRCESFIISNWMSMKGYFCCLFPRIGKLALPKPQILCSIFHYQVLLLHWQGQQLHLTFRALTTPPQVPPLPFAKVLGEVLSHVPSAQD